MKIFDMKKSLFFMLVILTILTIENVYAHNTVPDYRDSMEDSDYSHSPIHIASNVEFTLLNGVSEGSGIADDPYIIENWWINASTVHAIWIENTDAYFIIRNCYMYDGGLDYSCIFVNNVQNGRVEYSAVTRSWYGIHLYSSLNITLTDNAVYENYGDGIYLDSFSHYNIVTNNIIHTNHIGINLKTSSNNTLVNNAVYENHWDGIRLWNSSNNTLTDNAVYENYGDGIYLDLSSSNALTNNAVYENNDGIELDSFSHYNIVTNNTVYDNHIGINLKSSSNNTLVKNTVYRNSWDGFRLWNSLNNTLTANIIYGNNNNNGIGLFSSSNNTITHNMIYGNANGIYLISSSYNSIYHNHLINNTQNGYDENPANNNWHHPILLEGNYWSDYSGLDDGSGVGKHSIAGDGIGDTLVPHPDPSYDDYPFANSVLVDPNFNISVFMHILLIMGSLVIIGIATYVLKRRKLTP